jgi:hypothetical protein
VKEVTNANRNFFGDEKRPSAIFFALFSRRQMVDINKFSCI